MRHALVTGGAGFIGSHLVDLLLNEGWRVTVVDNFDPFYDPAIKRVNLNRCAAQEGFKLVEADVRDLGALRRSLAADYDVIIHLAAKAGVRPSIQHPVAYYEVNVGGTQNILELARELGVGQFVFASSSSVYGVNPHVPWREDDTVLLPISPYASTKVSGELIGHVYSHLHGIRFIALRFFTVYGPRQRPDLAILKFARLMVEGKPVPFFGDGTMRRDYTYINDILSGIRAAMDFDGSMYEATAALPTDLAYSRVVRRKVRMLPEVDSIQVKISLLTVAVRCSVLRRACLQVVSWARRGAAVRIRPSKRSFLLSLCVE